MMIKCPKCESKHVVTTVLAHLYVTVNVNEQMDWEPMDDTPEYDEEDVETLDCMDCSYEWKK